jgi:glycosyltransferase involved in cell wall biosynthesis
VAVVPDGARLTTPVPWPADPLAPCTVAYAGHLYAWKGVDVLLAAISHVPGVQGLVIGGHEKEADLARLRALAVRLGVDSRVTFTGHLAPSDVAGRLAQADILVLPNPASAISTHATSPLKLFEYMAAGKAIIAPRQANIEEILTDERDTLFFTPENHAELRSALRRVVEVNELREQIGRGARETIARVNLTWAGNAERIVRVYESLRRVGMSPAVLASSQA